MMNAKHNEQGRTDPEGGGMCHLQRCLSKQRCFCILQCDFAQDSLQILISKACLFTSQQLRGCSELSIQTDFPHRKGFLLSISGCCCKKFRTSKTFSSVEILRLFCSRGLNFLFQFPDFLRKERCFRLQNNQGYFLCLRALQGRNPWGDPGWWDRAGAPQPGTHHPAPPAATSIQPMMLHLSPDVLTPSSAMLDLPSKQLFYKIKWEKQLKKGEKLCARLPQLFRALLPLLSQLCVKTGMENGKDTS